MQKGNFFQRALRFAESKGFYMILGLCLVAIGVSAYVLFFTTPEQEVMRGQLVTDEPQAGVSGQVPDVIVPDEKEPTGTRQEGKKQDQLPPTSEQPPSDPLKEPEPAEPTTGLQPEKPSNAVQVGAHTTVKEPAFILPVQPGEIQRNYSGNDLVQDPTMGDWRTHNGTDFACDEGDTVMAVLDGSVAEIFEDAMRGQCIRIDHGAGLQSLYCGVIAQDGLKAGQNVTSGQTIGRVCNGNLAESAQACHLHLEMTEDGQTIDPMSVLK